MYTRLTRLNIYDGCRDLIIEPADLIFNRVRPLPKGNVNAKLFTNQIVNEDAS